LTVAQFLLWALDFMGFVVASFGSKFTMFKSSSFSCRSNLSVSSASIVLGIVWTVLSSSQFCSFFVFVVFLMCFNGLSSFIVIIIECAVRLLVRTDVDLMLLTFSNHVADDSLLVLALCAFAHMHL